jgi:hypothetical protein
MGNQIRNQIRAFYINESRDGTVRCNLDKESETVVPRSDQIHPSSPNPVSISHSQTQNSFEELTDVGTPITIPALPSSDNSADDDFT